MTENSGRVLNQFEPDVKVWLFCKMEKAIETQATHCRAWERQTVDRLGANDSKNDQAISHGSWNHGGETSAHLRTVLFSLRATPSVTGEKQHGLKIFGKAPKHGSLWTPWTGLRVVIEWKLFFETSCAGGKAKKILSRYPSPFLLFRTQIHGELKPKRFFGKRF